MLSHASVSLPTSNAAPRSGPIRVVLADDHDLVRCGIRLLLEQGDIEVVGEARDGEELLAVVRQEKPDVVLTDIDMPLMDGLRATEVLREHHPATKVLVLSAHDEASLLRQAVASGADGYLLKNAPSHELGQAVRAVASSGQYFSAGIAKLLLERGEPSPGEQLTERQLEVLKLIACGKSSKEIAFELGLSSKTVDVHRARLMERLSISDIAGLTRYAIRMRLVVA